MSACILPTDNYAEHAQKVPDQISTQASLFLSNTQFLHTFCEGYPKTQQNIDAHIPYIHLHEHNSICKCKTFYIYIHTHKCSHICIEFYIYMHTIPQCHIYMHIQFQISCTKCHLYMHNFIFACVTSHLHAHTMPFLYAHKAIFIPSRTDIHTQCQIYMYTVSHIHHTTVICTLTSSKNTWQSGTPGCFFF